MTITSNVEIYPVKEPATTKEPAFPYLAYNDYNNDIVFLVRGFIAGDDTRRSVTVVREAAETSFKRVGIVDSFHINKLTPLKENEAVILQNTP